MTIKNTITAIAILFAFNTIAKDDIKLKSKITKVTVYQQGAQIKRKASYNVSKGVNKIIIEGISPNIDPNSIQVNATGNVILLDSKYNIEYPTPEIDPTVNNQIPKKILREISLLTDSIFDITYNLKAIEYKINVLTSEKRIIENNGTIKGTGKVNDSIPLLENAIEFYHNRMNLINTELLKLSKKQAKVLKVNNRMNTRLKVLRNYTTNNNMVTNQTKKPIYKVTITVSAKDATSGRIYLTYLVNRAGWIPLYDLRSKTSNNTINLTYKAQVYQNTGVKWENVRLNLSTNNPYANKTKPELNPWYLNYTTAYNTYRTNEISKDIKYKKESRPMNKRAMSEESAPVVTESEDEYTIDAKDSYEFTQMIEQLVSVEYAIDLPYTIESTNEKYMVLIDSKTLESKYKYYAVPKLDLSCYLVTQITNLDELNLIPGNATIFHDGAYLGVTYLNPSIMSDTMNLSLGKDPKIQIKRTLLKNESKEKIIGDKLVKTYAYQIDIKNHHSKTSKLTIQDQIPVTQNSEIEIELVNLSKGRLNKVTGIIEWDLRLKAHETKKINLIYTVKYSKNQNVNITAQH